MSSLQIYTTNVLASQLSTLLLHHSSSLHTLCSYAGRWIVIMGRTADEGRDKREGWGDENVRERKIERER